MLNLGLIARMCDLELVTYSGPGDFLEKTTPDLRELSAQFTKNTENIVKWLRLIFKSNSQILQLCNLLSHKSVCFLSNSLQILFAMAIGNFLCVALIFYYVF